MFGCSNQPLVQRNQDTLQYMKLVSLAVEPHLTLALGASPKFAEFPMVSSPARRAHRRQHFRALATFTET